MSVFSGRARNLAWRQFSGDHSRFRSGPAQTAKREAELVADLHAAATTYPEDERLAELIAELRAECPIVYSVAPDTPDAEALARLGELVLGGVPG
jgi:hypothetical protein